ncbi:ABC transporter ATP-binding protein [Desulfolithobacter dissulfuricans]|uniref:ABC transporter ATP-binding protein n=1 Tax=Desulfolithobacter dissulfuricans TaxID=2795293 RepID=A0A915XIX3_9BACT|nr:ATP-binding cassette domain-containing protein [Desulfolithobacter dissulfuricans]BCO08067.1 ABC transporter ATP-binding protein [Desulfolithobacter dissulfuricans]
MITLTDCSKYFHRGSVNEVFALNRINLQIEEGDFVTVIGSNGAGKSTLLNCIAGCFFPDSGRILINNHDVTRWPEYRRARFISRVFQDPLLGTCPSATIEQNLALALLRGKRRGLRRGVKARDRQLFRDRLAQLGLGLEERLLDRVGLLSGGQRQALTMLMATMVRPEVLLLDEHIAALDPKTANQILTLTRDIVAEQGLTTMMITHNMHHAINFGNRLIMLHQGRIILDVRGKKKSGLTVEDLVRQFYEAQGEDLALDSMLLA